MLGGFAGVVEAVLREFHAESVKRAFVHARDEPFHCLGSKELEAPKALLKFRGGVDGHEVSAVWRQRGVGFASPPAVNL